MILTLEIIYRQVEEGNLPWLCVPDFEAYFNKMAC